MPENWEIGKGYCILHVLFRGLLVLLTWQDLLPEHAQHGTPVKYWVSHTWQSPDEIFFSYMDGWLISGLTRVTAELTRVGKKYGLGERIQLDLHKTGYKECHIHLKHYPKYFWMHGIREKQTARLINNYIFYLFK